MEKKNCRNALNVLVHQELRVFLFFSHWILYLISVGSWQAMSDLM